MAAAENTCGMFTAQLSIKPDALPYFAHNVFVYDKPNVWTMTEENEPVKGVMISARMPENDSDSLRQIDLLTPMPWHECEAWADTKVGHRGDDYQSNTSPNLANSSNNATPVRHSPTATTWVVPKAPLSACARIAAYRC